MPLQQIKSRFDDRILYECEAESLLAALQEAVKTRADLRGAYLRGAYLRGAYLRGADLRGAYLRGAYLRGAYLRGADLREAYLQGADLREADLREAYLRGAYLREAYLQGADLQGAKINWQSHQLIGELLRRAARDDVAKRKVAGLVTISTDWCWDQFLVINDPLRDWALGVLVGYVTDGDGAPQAVVSCRTEAPA